MDPRPKKKQRKNAKTSDIHNELPIFARNETPSNTNIYDPSLIFEQDYEYQLSLIADMEKQDKIERECMEQIEKMEALVSAAELETRNFHIKQVLRKIKLGFGTNLQDKIYISMLESWMDTNLLSLNTEHAYSFHSFLETKIRISKETIDYMKNHVCI